MGKDCSFSFSLYFPLCRQEAQHALLTGGAARYASTIIFKQDLETTIHKWIDKYALSHSKGLLMFYPNSGIDKDTFYLKKQDSFFTNEVQS